MILIIKNKIKGYENYIKELKKDNYKTYCYNCKNSIEITEDKIKLLKSILREGFIRKHKSTKYRLLTPKNLK